MQISTSKSNSGWTQLGLKLKFKFNSCIFSVNFLLFIFLILLPSLSVFVQCTNINGQRPKISKRATGQEDNGYGGNNGNGTGTENTGDFSVARIYRDCYTKNKMSAGMDVWGCVGVGEEECIRRQNCHFLLAYQRVYHAELTHKTSFHFRLLDDATLTCSVEVNASTPSKPTHISNSTSKCPSSSSSSSSRHTINYPDRYVSVGFSASGKMGKDLVVSCISFQSVLDIVLSYNYNRQKGIGRGNHPLYNNMVDGDPGFQILQKNDIKMENGQLLCSFVLDASISVLKDNFTGKNLWDAVTFSFITDSYYILIASGRAKGANEVGYHLKSRYWTEENVDLSRVQTYIIPFDRTPAILAAKIHIVLMVTTYIVLLPSATLIARFFKESKQKTRCCFRRIWFMFHMIMMTMGALCVIFGNLIIGIFIGTFKKMYYKGAQPPEQTVKFSVHYFVGLFSAAAVVVNIILGAYLSLSHLDRGLSRIVLSFIHWSISVTAYILGILQIFLVPYLMPDQMDWCSAPSIVVLVWVVLHMGVYLYLTMLLYKRDKYYDDMERRSKEKMKTDFLVEFRKLKRANAEIHRLHLLQQKLQQQQHQQNPHQNPHGNQHPNQHPNPRDNHHQNPHQNPHENKPQNQHENPPQSRRQSGQRLSKVKENLKGPDSDSLADDKTSVETLRKMSHPSPPTSLQDHFSKRKTTGHSLGSGPQGRNSRSSTTDKKKSSSRNSRSSLTVNPPGLTSPRKTSLKNKGLVKPRIRWSQVNPLKSGGFEITRRKPSYSTLIKTRQLSPIKPNPESILMRKRSSLTRKISFSNQPKLNLIPNPNPNPNPEPNPNPNSNPKEDKGEDEDSLIDEFSGASPDPYLDLEESIKSQFEREGKDGTKDEEEDEEVEVVRILHQNRKKTDPFLEIDQFEVHQAAIRYEEKHDVKRAFRSYPLEMNFFVENPHTKQTEVILIVFFIVALVTSCVLCYTTFPPPDQRRGQCEDENGGALWMKII